MIKRNRLLVWSMIGGLVAAAVITGLAVFFSTVSEDDDPPNNLKNIQDQDSYWGYECIENKCERQPRNASNIDKLETIQVCQLMCEEFSTLWPRPAGVYEANKKYPVSVNWEAISFDFPSVATHAEYWATVEERFFKFIASGVPDVNGLDRGNFSLKILVTIESESLVLHPKIDESYRLSVYDYTPSSMVAIIEAHNFYGARHAVESLSQLIIFDAFANLLIMPRTVVIHDGPVYEHRGFLLDTARHYYSIDAIKRTIDTMAMVKLNVFHWHITDSGSFAMVLASHPELSKEGTFSRHHKYTSEMIKDVVHFAKLRGVFVMPEFDAPSHVSEGWQNTGLVSCLDFKPWNAYCSAPPCGQLDPTQERLYEVLDKIYKDMFEMFDNPLLFHMGGDEVSVACWNSSEALRERMLSNGMQLNEEDFMDLWYGFQTRGDQLIEKINPNSRVVLWTSMLTNAKYFNKFDFDREKYIIQCWTSGTDPTIKNLLTQGYDLIISNYDSLYFDCGFNSWVGEGSNWCAPYKGWHRVYNNNLKNLVAEEHRSQILGSEACFWSSISDEVVLDSRVWPRLSALAERLWADPDENYRSAEARMLWHRERLVQSGISAEPIKPEWCMYNKGECVL